MVLVVVDANWSELTIEVGMEVERREIHTEPQVPILVSSAGTTSEKLGCLE